MKRFTKCYFVLAITAVIGVSMNAESFAGKKGFKFNRGSTRQLRSQSDSGGTSSTRFKLQASNSQLQNLRLNTRRRNDSNQRTIVSSPVNTAIQSNGNKFAPQFDPRKLNRVKATDLRKNLVNLQRNGQKTLKSGNGPSMINNKQLSGFASKFKLSKKTSLVPLNGLSSKIGNIIKQGQNQAKSGEQQMAKNFAVKKLSNKKCHWWVNLIIGLHHHHHHGCWKHCYDPSYWNCWHRCHWHYVSCHDHSRWYLGLDGFIVPNTGMGVDSVKPYSPAARAGLRAGNMIVSVNGQPLLSEDVLTGAIQTSGGILIMEVLTEHSDQPVLMTVHLQRIRGYSY